MEPRADIIIPVCNERDNLPALFTRLQALPDFAQYRLILVDNASSDGSAEYLQDIAGITLIRHTHNLGYGASLRSGIAAGRADAIVIIDADCEYPPECIPQLLNALQQHNVVYASRLLGKRSAEAAGMSTLKWLGNRIISGFYNRLFGRNTSDLYTGCKALRRQCLQNISLQRDGFEQVVELAAKIAARGYHIADIAVDYVPRTRGQSKMSHVTETLKYFFWLLYYRALLSWPRDSEARDSTTRNSGRG